MSTRMRVAAVTIAVLLPALPACSGSSPSLTTSVSTSSTTIPGALDPASLQEALDGARDAYGAPGTLALVRTGDERWFGESGTADTAGTGITDSTRFRIASITKPIIAALVLDSVARGEMSLDDRIDDLLPGVLVGDPDVSVRMLLDHTSGIFDITNVVTDLDVTTAVAALTDPTQREEAEVLLTRYVAGEQVIARDGLIVALAETQDRYNRPGGGFHYSNVNYQLAAMALEAVTGRDLSELLVTRIAEPLGLERTTVAPPDMASPELRGYGISLDDGSLIDVTDDLFAFGNGGNGGIVSTADDLLTIMQALLSGRIVPEPYLADMMDPTIWSNRSYGLGLATYTLTCGTFYGHEGGVNGTASIALVTRGGDRGIVIAFNLRDGTSPGMPALADRMLCGIG